MLIGALVLAVALLAFLGGLFAFKVKSRWCRTCGATLGCVECRDRSRIVRADR
jgi:hypothetical protein